MNSQFERPKSVSIIAGWLAGLSVLLLLLSLLVLPMAFPETSTTATTTSSSSFQPTDGYSGLMTSLGRTWLTFAVPYGVLGLVASTGMFRAKEWGRVLCIIHSVVICFAFPIGTIIGIACIIPLGKSDAQDFFQGKLHSCQKTAEEAN